MKFKVAYVTDPGREDKTNEDYYGYNIDIGLFAVADGVGGYAGGDIASKMAVESVMERLEKSLTGIKMSQEEVEKEISDAIREANNKIIEEKQRDKLLAEMGTTLSLILVEGDKMYTAFVGNSRVMHLIKDNPILYKNELTDDDSPVWAAYDRGEINIETAVTSHQRGLIKRYLGKKEGSTPVILTTEAYNIEKVLLSTDGLTDNAHDEEIGCILKEYPIEEAVKKLLNLAKNPRVIAEIYAEYYTKNKDVLEGKDVSVEEATKKLGGRDNITIVGVEFIK